jgi:hypothetical protein
MNSSRLFSSNSSIDEKPQELMDSVLNMEPIYVKRWFSINASTLALVPGEVFYILAVACL